VRSHPRRTPRAKLRAKPRTIWTPARQAIVEWLCAHSRNQRWLARELRVSASYVAMILNGRRVPSLRVAIQLQDLTGFPATAFIHSRAA
jgi:hypothetical protein